MPIQQDRIKDEYKGREIVARRVSFLRRAAAAAFDEDKWAFFGKLRAFPKDKKVGNVETPYLIAFEYESARSYVERLILSKDPGFTKEAHGAIAHLVREATKSIEITGLSPEIEAKFRKNIDDEGTPWEIFFAEVAEEILRLGKSVVATDSDGQSLTSFIVPLENVRNFAKGGETFRFITWDDVEEVVDGIAVERLPAIVIFTEEETARAILNPKTKKLELQEPVPIPFGYPPVRDGWFAGTGESPLDILANIQFDFMNLDSEIRKGNRRQVGMAILEHWDGLKMDSLTETSRAPLPRGSDIPATRWAEPGQSSFQSHFTYWDKSMAMVKALAKQVGQKAGAEAAKAKMIDFTAVEAVYTSLIKTTKDVFERVVKDWGAWNGVDATAVITVEEDLDFETAQEKINTLLAELAAGFGELADTALRKDYLAKRLEGMDEDRLQAILAAQEDEPLATITTEDGGQNAES